MTGEADREADQARLDAWFDNELSEHEVEALYADAANDAALAKSFASTRRLRRAFAELPPDPPPARLSARLRDIGEPATRTRYLWPAVAAAVLLALFIVPTWRTHTQLQQLTQTREELRIALQYLTQANRSANRRIENSLEQSLNEKLSITTLQTLNAYLDSKEI